MPNQVDGAFLHAPCPVPSCPACEPNSGSVLSSVSTKAYSSPRGPTLLCNQVPARATHLRPWRFSCGNTRECGS